MSATEDARRLIPAAMDRFGARVHAVPPDRWDAPTPCSAWSVRDLVAHMCFEHRWAPHVLAGEAMETVGDRYDGDLLDDDPVRGWDRAAVVSRAAWIARDAHASPVAGPDRAVHLVLTLTAAPGDPDSGRLTRR